MLFMSFTTCPAPIGPQWVISLPSVTRYGISRSTTAASPPTMMLSVPSRAAWRGARDRRIGEVNLARREGPAQFLGERDGAGAHVHDRLAALNLRDQPPLSWR